MSEKRVIVIGAGVGGLVAAALLAHRGHRVTVLERASLPGGKIHQRQVGPAWLDAGPTVLTMRWVFEELFDGLGDSFERRVPCTRLEVLARHAWRDGACLDLFAERERSAAAIARFAGTAEAARFGAFCDEVGRLYRALEASYIRAPRLRLASMGAALGPRGLALLAGLGPFATLWRCLGRRFRDPRLRQLFARYATYCGSSPLAAPATLALIAQVEMDGVWKVSGGMIALAQALAALAERQGATILYGRDVAQIEVGASGVRGVRLVDGEALAADAVVHNGDAAALQSGALGLAVGQAIAPLPVAGRSLSALTWSMLANAQGFPLTHHNVFFDADYASEFRDIFGARRLPRRATVYLCAQDRTDESGAPAGPERLFCLVNAPPCADAPPLQAKEIEQCQTNMLDLLHSAGLRLSPAAAPVTTTPADFQRMFPATGGALYGQATHGWLAPFRRPAATTRIPGLVLAGGSVHPGPGVPMAALSGGFAAAALTERLASTRVSNPAGIAGGISTR